MPRFKVHSKTGGSFRRNGIVFTSKPQTIDTDKLGWTPQQMTEFYRSYSALYIADASGDNEAENPERGKIEGTTRRKEPAAGTPAEAVKAAEVAGESLPGHPTEAEAESLSKPRRR